MRLLFNGNGYRSMHFPIDTNYVGFVGAKPVWLNFGCVRVAPRLLNNFCDVVAHNKQ